MSAKKKKESGNMILDDEARAEVKAYFEDNVKDSGRLATLGLDCIETISELEERLNKKDSILMKAMVEVNRLREQVRQLEKGS